MSTTDHSKAPAHFASTDLNSIEVDGDTGPGSVVTVIQPRTGWIAINWAELIHSHELFITLVGRDLAIRYKQTVLGIAWAVLQPLATMIVFSMVFGRALGIKTGDIAYPVFVLAGQVPWMFFSLAVGSGSISLLQHQSLLTKIYFPRIYVPAATVGSALVDMGIGLCLLLILMPFYGLFPGWGILALPLLILLAFSATLGLSLALSAATILYRDFRFLIPFGLQLGMFISPVFYNMEDRISRPLQFVLALNPMYGIINGFRSSILNEPWDFATLAVSAASTTAVLLFGLFFFRKTERLMSDLV
jgi:lipopolysaccharide transport system permease protein